MSWKACAYVKDLRDGLTVTEKFVLLMLAEYHRTDGKNEWPSTETLALDCLMEERSVRRIINRLIDGQFLERDQGGGRGRMSSYRIVGLDCKKRDTGTGIVETLIVETGIVTGTVGSANRDCAGQKQGPQSTRNKVLPDLPVKEPNGEIPPDLHGMQAAPALIGQVHAANYELPSSPGLIQSIARAFEALVATGKSPPAAFEFLVAVTLDAIEHGQRVDKFFFEDAKWRGNGNGKQSAVGAPTGTGNTARDKQLRSIASLRHAAAQHAPGGNARDTRER